MKILYVTPLVAGFEDILRGKAESRGLPSFIFPLKELIKRGHTVDIVLVSNYRGPINIKVDWIKNENIIANINNNMVDGKKTLRTINKLKSLCALLRLMKKCLKKKKYDFVYCHGTAALLGNIYANKYRVPCGYRVYGTIQLAKSIREKGIVRTAFLFPVYFMIFNIKKNYILITDDGTEGDYVYNQFTLKKDFPLYFWLNGIEKNINYLKCQLPLPEEKYIFHAARISKPKAQHNDIELLRKLHEEGIGIRLYLAGHIEEPKYKEELDAMIRRYKLEKYVIFLGDINREDLQNYARNAIAVPLLAEFNQGNVIYECMIAGTIVVTYYEKPLTRFISHGENGYFVRDIREAANIIKHLCEITDSERDAIKIKASEKIDKLLLTWEQRTEKEIVLLESI